MRAIQTLVLVAMAPFLVGVDATAQGTPNFSGTWVKNEQAGRNGGPPTVYVSRAKWSGNTLVVTREHEGQFVATQTLSLQGGKLTIAYSVNLDVTGSTLIVGNGLAEPGVEEIVHACHGGAFDPGRHRRRSPRESRSRADAWRAEHS